MGLVRFPIVLAVVLLLLSACGALENQSILSGDPRLDVKVTFEAAGITLAEVLAQLSASTGVDLVAGVDQNDWTARDRKLIVEVTGMRLGDLMREIAATLRFSWGREGEQGKWSYRLSQDAGRREEEESLRKTSESERIRVLREKRESALADLVKLSSLGAGEAASLKQSDPWRYVLATQPLGKDLAQFLSSFPDARAAFLSGNEVSFPVSSLSAAMQQTVRRIAESYDSLARSIGASADHSELLSRFEKLQITINRAVGVEDGLLPRSRLGRITIGVNQESLDIPLFDPSSALSRALGTAIVRLQGGVAKDQVARDLQSAVEAAAKAAYAPSGPPRDTSSDPDMKKKVKLFDVDTNASLVMTLAALARGSKLNVISDYFPGAAVTVAAGQKSLGEQLAVIRAGYNTDWEKAGGLIRFRDPEWFTKRAWEVPEGWIRYWLSRAGQNEGLLFEDLVQIGNLRDEQLDHAIARHPGLVSYGAGEAVRNRHILRFYAALSPEQRTQLLSGSGITVSSLDESQWTALKTALATKGAAYAAVEKGSQTARLSQSGTTVIEYLFSYFAGGPDPAVTFKLQTGVVYRTAPG